MSVLTTTRIWLRDGIPPRAVLPVAPKELPPMAATHNDSKFSLIRNVLTGYLGTAVTTLTGFFVTPLLLRYLGDRQFGLWTLLLTIMAYVGLIELGMYATVSKRVAECLATKDKDRLEVVLGTALAIYLALTVVIITVVCLLLPFIGSVFHLTPDLTRLAQQGLVILCLGRCIAFAFMPEAAALFGAGRMDLVTMGALLITTAASVWNVFQAMHGGSIVFLSGTTALATLLIGLVNVMNVRRLFPGLVIHVRGASRPMARELLKFGSRNSLHSIFGNIAYNSDQIIIALLMTTSAVANYAIAAKLASMVSLLATKPINALLPAYSHARASNDKEREFKMFTQSVMLSLIVCMPFAITGCLLGDRLIRAWVGVGHQAAYSVLFVLLLTVLLVQPGNASVMIMNATERNIFLVRAYMVAAPINLLISWQLTKSVGLIGPAIGSMTTYLIVDAALLPIVVCRDFGFRYAAYLREGLGPALLPLLAGCAAAAALRFSHLPDKRIVTLLMLGAITATCWSVWFLAALSPARRRDYTQMAQTILNKRKKAAPDAA